MAGYVDYSWSDRAAGRVGHFAAEMLMLAIVAIIALGLRPPDPAVALSVSVLLLVWVLGSWMLMRRHDRSLCEHCAAHIPLNPSELASRYGRRFWIAHTGMQPQYLVPYLAVLIGSNFLTSPTGRIAWALVQSTMIYLIMAHTAHRRLQPWCPWCQNGNGGDHEEVKPWTPDPTPGKQFV